MDLPEEGASNAAWEAYGGAGWTLIRRSLTMSTLSVRLPDSLHKRVKQMAEGEGISMGII